MADKLNPGRKLAAAASVILGTATSAVVIMATSDARWATVSGLAALVVAWASVEWYRAKGDEAGSRRQKRLKIKMDLGSVEDRSTVLGAHGTPDADAHIQIKGKKISGKSRVEGYSSDLGS